MVAYLIIVVLFVGAFYAGMRYGRQLESDAYTELAKLKAALVKTGVNLETYLSGDIAKIKTAAETLLAKL